jgi:hypothetical protein
VLLARDLKGSHGSQEFLACAGQGPLQGTPRPQEFLASAGQGPPIAVDVAVVVAVSVLAVAAAVLLL